MDVTDSMRGLPKAVLDYLKAYYSAEYLDGIHVVSVPGDPNQSKGWFGGRLGSEYRLGPDENIFHAVGVLDPKSVGRSITNVVTHVGIWFDDIGTKVPLEKMQDLAVAGFWPTSVVETSPGNFQYGFRLAVPVAEDGGEAAQVLAALKDTLKRDGWGDPACFDPVRYMRLPGGINGKGKYSNPLDGSAWRVRLASLDPENSVDLYKLAEYVIGPNFLALATSGAYLPSRVFSAGGGGSLGRNASMSDPLVKLAEAVGLNPRPSTRAGVIDCDCPHHAVTGAHTNGLPEGYAFINDGMSFCNHGHCADLNSIDFQEMIVGMYDAQVALGMHQGGPESGRGFLAGERFRGKALEQGETPEDLLAQAEEIAQAQARREKVREDDLEALRQAIESWVIFINENLGFFDTRNYRMLTADQFDRDPEVIRAWPLGGKAKDKASLAILNRGRVRRVEGVVRKPGAGLIVSSADANGVVMPMVNIYRPSDVGRKPGRTPQSWLDHIKRLFPDPVDHTYFVEAVAWAIQNPDKPMPIILALVGAPGTGKDMLFRPVMHLVGLHNCDSVSPERLAGAWTDWMTKRFLMLGEFTTRNHPTLHERLRDWTSPTPVWATINRKYARAYQIQTSMWFVMTSNDTDALAGLQADDRRFAFMRTEAQRIHEQGSATTPFTNLYFEHLAREWETQDFLEGLHEYLLTLPITTFNPNQAPPLTAGKQEIAVDSLSPAARWIFDEVTGGDFAHRTLIAANELDDGGNASSNFRVKQSMTSRAIRDGMRNAGAVSLRRVRASSGRLVRLWTGAGLTKQKIAALEQLTPDQLRAAWEAEMAAPKPNPFAGQPASNVVPLAQNAKP